MKQLNTAAAAVLIAAAMLGGCHKSGSNAGKDVTNPTDSAPVNTAQDAAGGVVGMASGATAPTTAVAFVPAAAIGNSYEIQAGQIAVQRAQAPEVKDLARMMVKDHTQIGQQMQQTLATAGANVTPPADLDDRRKGMIQNLKAAGSSDFDLAYLHQQLAAHIEVLELMKRYASGGDNAALKALAAKTAPKIQMHLDEVKRVGGAKLTGAANG